MDTLAGGQPDGEDHRDHRGGAEVTERARSKAVLQEVAENAEKDRLPDAALCSLCDLL
jgi:hypothetical protein